MYDYAHGQSDSIEQVTHSMCTLEFEDHRPLYNWFIEQLGIFPSQQYEFDRLNLTYTLLSKRKLLTLVQDGHVNGWDDPRMPTLSGIRRRGYTPEAICAISAGRSVYPRPTALRSSRLLEHFVREDLNKRATRVMGVLRPLRVVIDNYPDDLVEEMDAINNPEDPDAGTRKVPFSKVLYIEQEDFREDPPKQYFRLAPGREVRLRYGYFIKCTGVVKDDARQYRRAALHVRSGHPRRQLAGRTQGEVDHPLGLGGARSRRRGSSVRHPVHERKSERCRGRPGFHRQSESDIRCEVLTDAKWSPACVDAAPGRGISSSGLGYFCCRPGFDGGAACVQSHGRIAG